MGIICSMEYQMKKQTAVEYFGSEAKLARFLGLTNGAVNQWGEYIPQGRAYQIELMTKGKLKASFPKLKKAS